MNNGSLTGLISIWEDYRSKAKFLGLGDSVICSNFAKANRNRYYHIFEEFACYLVEQARMLYEVEARVTAFSHITTASVQNSQVMKEIRLRQSPATSLIKDTTSSYNSIGPNVQVHSS